MVTELRWRKSQRSNSGQECLELAHTGDRVRDSKNPDGPQLRFGPSAVPAFVASVAAGWFDR